MAVIPTSLRTKVLSLRGLHCFWCGYASDDAADFHIDHLKPQARGGSNAVRNLQVACAPCNESRGAKPASQQREWVSRSMHLRQTPQERFDASLDQMRSAMVAVRGV